jgi:cytochrome c biogenesis protein CcmG/thiol:disulfide interchange protein DsbE
MRYALPLGLLLLLLMLFWFGLGTNPTLVPSPLIGKPLPRFELPELRAPDLVLHTADLTGRPALLNVWASWCVECRHEHPLLLELSRTGVFPVYGLNYKDEREDALRWLERYGDPYTASLHDLHGRAGLDLGVYGVPETFVIDAGGVIRYKHVGAIDERVLRERILPLLDEARAASPDGS